MKKKTKKIKIILSVSILLIFTIIVGSILIMSFNTISYAMAFKAPAKIIVYYNEQLGNQVYDAGSAEYNDIYSSICNSYEQSVLKAFVNGELNKDIKIKHTDKTAIDFTGIKVNFVYNTPQVVKYKNSLYSNNGTNYWYQNLIFTISDTNSFQYNTVAIIPPVNDRDYVNQYTYSLTYNAYSNLGKTHTMLSEYFK